MSESKVFSENLIGYFEEQTRKDCSVPSIIRTLGAMNSMSVLLEDSPGDKKALMDFTDYFLKRFGVSEETMFAIHETWLNLPRVLRLGLQYREEDTLLQMKPFYDKLRKSEQRKADSLSEYLMELSGWREFVFFFSDETKVTVPVESRPGKKEREYNRNILRLNIARCLSVNGVLLVFLSEKKTGTDMYGLMMKNGIIRNIPSLRLQNFLRESDQMSVHYAHFGIDFNEELSSPIRLLEEPVEETLTGDLPEKREDEDPSPEQGDTEDLPSGEKGERNEGRSFSARIIQLPFGDPDRP